MAQKTAWDGAALTESDINTYLMGEGGAWTSWTPAVVQSGSVTVTNTRSTYARYGRLIVATFNLAVTGSGTTTNNITVSLPVTAAAAGSGGGAGFILNTGTAFYYGYWNVETTTTIALIAGTGDRVGTNPNFALAATDVIRGVITYEAAS